MRKTILGREIPDQLDGIELKPFAGAFAARPSGTRAAPPRQVQTARRGQVPAGP